MTAFLCLDFPIFKLSMITDDIVSNNDSNEEVFGGLSAEMYMQYLAQDIIKIVFVIKFN